MFDSIVVGAGHAGIEAALIQAKAGLNVLVITGDLTKVGSMPCNPSIGGPAKGIIVREVDALGGVIGKASDYCAIQKKILNPSKGPAVRALRFQIDKEEYKRYMLNLLEENKNITLVEDYVRHLIIKDGMCIGVKTKTNSYYSKTTIITTGTYLKSNCLIGLTSRVSGPDGEMTTSELGENLKELGFKILRLKTGTPARVLTKSINFAKLKEEPGTDEDLHFAHNKSIKQKHNVNIPCFLTYTNSEIHNLILDNLNESAMYSGNVSGVGPRYCPSIEDKVVRFRDKERHQIFLEPESLELDTTYIQGLSTSFSIPMQDQIYHLVPGLEKCIIKKYAYAIEYDAIDSTDLYPTLETILVKNLYTAGQINGTSGYEEAAGQGIIAGINSLAKIKNLKPFILKRNEAYIGVMIDDLVTKGVTDPYRLLTSRAEFRLILRHDNADLRLMKKAYTYGLINEETYQRLQRKEELINEYEHILNNLKIKPSNIKELNLEESKSVTELLKRPDVTISALAEFIKEKIDLNDELNQEVLEQIEINLKYEGYIKKQEKEIKKLLYYENIKLPADFNYNEVTNLASEAKEKLNKIKPLTIGQATRISGVNPVDITALILHLEVKKRG